jgi:hypothetical protein
MNGNQSLDQQRAEMAEKALDATLAATEKKANEYQDLAQSQRWRYSIAKALAVVLGVSTPTFVAFQTQHPFPDYNLLFSLIAICLTTGAGIVSGLQAAFKWGEGARRWRPRDAPSCKRCSIPSAFGRPMFLNLVLADNSHKFPFVLVSGHTTSIPIPPRFTPAVSRSTQHHPRTHRI